ncbi:homeobox protein PKNOX1.1 [Chanos chanos]|uniref:Homeobox protein PKNOX1.1 n=1 Tax=Chanos chanos TaxID=29144 RepID=A0A6J2WE75_CHACN|nr:homeobox protein PKNOX1-like [Chanos chanos]
MEMMEAQSTSIEKYQEGEQQMQGVEQGDGDPEKGLNDGNTGKLSSPSPTKPQTPMDADKASIYKHPLFPLLALLFEKCELSTQGSDCVTSASFDVDIENFVRGQEKEGKAFFSEDPELDNLMVKAIQVLRIHLLELEKVNDLCKDFCSRYIACLKTKMNSETLLSGEPGSPYSPTQTQTSSSFTGSVSPQGIMVPASALQQGNVTVTAVNPTQMVAGGTVYQPVTVVTPQGQVVTQTLSPGTIRIQNSQLQLQLNQDLSFFSADDSSSKNKRGVLPKHATNVMRSWLFQHIGHPYPTEDEKKQIASQTNLTLLQVNNWFINARRRILQPMLDASSAETPKSKKKTPQNRPLQRFWPDSIASSVPQQQLAMPDGTMVTVGMSVDGFQTLSDGAALAMQQAELGNHSEEETDESGDEDDMHLSSANMHGLGLDASD